MRRLTKILHEVGTVGVMGPIAAALILIAGSTDATPAEYAAIRRGIDAMARLVLVPSLGLVLATGVLAIAIHRPFHDAGWAWIKALLGVSMLEGTLVGVAGNAQQAARVVEEVAAGLAAPGSLEALHRHERGAMWIIMVLSLVNIVLGVWRPKLRRTVKAAPRPAPEPASGEAAS